MTTPAPAIEKALHRMFGHLAGYCDLKSTLRRQEKTGTVRWGASGAEIKIVDYQTGPASAHHALAMIRGRQQIAAELATIRDILRDIPLLAHDSLSIEIVFGAPGRTQPRVSMLLDGLDPRPAESRRKIPVLANFTPMLARALKPLATIPADGDLRSFLITGRTLITAPNRTILAPDPGLALLKYAAFEDPALLARPDLLEGTQFCLKEVISPARAIAGMKTHLAARTMRRT